MHMQSSLITKPSSRVSPWRYDLIFTNGYHHSRRFVIWVILYCANLANAQSAELEPGFTYTVNQVEITSNGTRLIGPIMLSLQPWIAHARGGLTVKTPQCDQQFILLQLTVSDHRQRWAEIQRVEHCLSTHRLSLQTFKIHIGQIRLSIGQLVFDRQGDDRGRIYDAHVSCGELLPLTLSAPKGTLSQEQVVLKDITLGINGYPIGWFPKLNVTKSGRLGILPPTLSIQPEEVRVGVPIYLPFNDHQALTLTPGYQSHRHSPDRIFGRAAHQWRQPHQDSGIIRVSGDSRFITLQGAGGARLSGWSFLTQGNTRFGVRALENDPSLNLQSLTGFSRGGIRLGWSNQRYQWGLELDRSLSQDQRLSASSRFVHHLGTRRHFKIGYIGFNQSTQVRLEPDSVWLSEGTASLLLEDRWWGLSATSKTQIHLQYGTHAPLMHEGIATLGVPTVHEALTLKSIWSRDYDFVRHHIGVHGGLSTYLRSDDRMSPLDTRIRPGARRSQRLYSGFISSVSLFETFAAIELNGVYVEQSNFAADDFAQVRTVLQREHIELEATYAHQRSVFVQSRLSPTPSMALHSTYFAQRYDAIPSDLLIDTRINIKPTIGQHLGWQGDRFEVTGSVWFPQNHRRVHAGAIAMTQHPECECFSWTSEIKYVAQLNNLWLTVQLELALEQGRRSQVLPLTVGVVP
jgi:hypothetical protein